MTQSPTAMSGSVTKSWSAPFTSSRPSRPFVGATWSRFRPVANRSGCADLYRAERSVDRGIADSVIPAERSRRKTSYPYPSFSATTAS